MAKIAKEVILKEELIEKINNLPNCPNGHSDTYDKATLLRIIESMNSKHVSFDVDDFR